MYISRVTIRNIRCYEDLSIHPARGVNILIGENNSGKSTLLGAIMELQRYMYDAGALRDPQYNGIIELGLADVPVENMPQPDREHLQQRGLRSISGCVARKVINRGGPVNSTYSEIPGVPDFTRNVFPSARPHNVIFPYLSSRRAAQLTDNVGTQYSTQITGNLEHLQSKIDAIYTSAHLRPIYEAHCQTVLGFVVSTFQTSSGKAAGIEVDARRGRTIRIAEMGTGVINALGLIVDLIVADAEIFVVEELENDMHPKALRALLDLVMARAARGSQFFMSTHSNILVRHVGIGEDAKVFHVRRQQNDSQLPSVIDDVPPTPAARRAVLSQLGYELFDYEIYDAWLLLEESSAERIIREFIVPWFIPTLTGRLRTVSATGASGLEPKMSAFHDLFLFLHLEEAYNGRAWVLADGDEAGRNAIQRLRDEFLSWPTNHFDTFRKEQFEFYYPRNFSLEVERVLKIENRGVRREEKEKLLQQVVGWLRTGGEEQRAALRESADEVIRRIEMIAEMVGVAKATVSSTR